MPDPVVTLATSATQPAPAANPPASPPQQPPAKPAAAKPAPASPPSAFDLAHMTPDQRAGYQRAQVDRDARRGTDFLHERDDRGNPRITDRATGQVVEGEGAAPAGDQPAPAAAQAKVKVGDIEISPEALSAMMQRQAEQDLRKATLPASPELYEAKLPEGMKLPGGIEYKFDLTDPSMIAARNLAHAKGWSQQDFSDALGIFASHIAGQEAKLAEIARAEIARAGPNAPQRVDFVGKWLDGFMGTADAKPIKATICTDAHLRFIEKVISSLTSQGAASFSGKHRDVEPRGVDDATWNSWSYSQKKAYAENSSARQNRGR
jgi:hypothetical protein